MPEILFGTDGYGDSRGSFTKAGTPTNGTSGTLVGIAYKGATLIDTTNGKHYVNDGTLASPLWKPVGFMFENAGVPVSGTTFANVAHKGALLTDTTNAKLYMNTNTLASPLWIPLGFVFTNAGVPVDGTTLANVAAKGSLLVDTTNADIYINANTLASPTWKLITRAA